MQQLTTDGEIIEVAERDNRIVVTKDSDFFKHYLVAGRPSRILFITTGNIVNRELLEMFQNNFLFIVQSFQLGKKIIELSDHSVIIHE